MKWFFVGAMLLLTGCASVKDLEQAPPSMEVRSGKDVDVYTQCLVGRLAESRSPATLKGTSKAQKIIVPSKVAAIPAAVIHVDESSRGSRITLHERMANNPIRPSDIREAVKRCID
jgi:hypothetical protein